MIILILEVQNVANVIKIKVDKVNFPKIFVY